MTEFMTFDYRAAEKNSALSYVQIHLQKSTNNIPIAYFNIPGTNFNLCIPCDLKVIPVHLTKEPGVVVDFLELRATDVNRDLSFTLVQARQKSLYAHLPQIGDGHIGDLRFIHLTHPQSLLAVARYGRDWIKALSIV